MMNINANAVQIGISKLSFMGSGKNSIVIPIAAPTKAIQGETNIKAPKNAKKNPPKEPSSVFDRLNGIGFLDSVPPMRDAVLSPKVKMAMAA